MTLKKIGYAALIAVATAAVVIGSAGSGEAKSKKKMAAPPPPPPPTCWFTVEQSGLRHQGRHEVHLLQRLLRRTRTAAEMSSSHGECKAAKMAQEVNEAKKKM